ncbi:carbohydrate ABC transporter permease [Roseibium sediminicola]|uniref:Carbohydrate ABC transporter permease n=1 Tax=Roseibium sediminicola TaxID=2933272 RepID=A0ABT0GRE2_9HYPH|nr:carbohydrate ABC transporter permease [Roseibium sp. CAU 1639]MCK7611790.1 carbohydrate ABC transporter permease [Roseibium sp. CAU 1639]
MSALRRSTPLAVTGKYLALAFYVGFALFPLYWLAKIAITPDKLIYTEGTALFPSKVTFENFETVLVATDFLAYFKNSLIVSLGTAAITTCFAAAAGYAFSRFDFRGKRLVIALMLITQMFPLLMIIAPIYKIVAAIGLLNSLTSLIIVYTAFNIPFATFLMQSFFDGIPKDLEEAGMIDGCTRFEALRKIIMPLTLPGLGATLGFVFTAAWSELLFALMLINSNDTMTFPVGLLTFVSKFSVDWGQMMAAGVLALVPSCLFFIFIQRYLVQGLTSGAVKG